jgi:hypothetical protein
LQPHARQAVSMGLRTRWQREALEEEVSLAKVSDER